MAVGSRRPPPKLHRKQSSSSRRFTMTSTKAKDKLLFNKSSSTRPIPRFMKLQLAEMQVYESIHRQNQKHTHTHIQSQQPNQAKQIQLANESGDTRSRSTPRAPPGIDATPVRCERTGRLIDKKKREAIRNEIRSKRRKTKKSRDVESPPHQLESGPTQQEKEVCEQHIKKKSTNTTEIDDTRDNISDKGEDTNSSRCGIRQRIIDPPPLRLVSKEPPQKAIRTHSIKTVSIQIDSIQQDDTRDYIREKRMDTRSSRRCGIKQRLIDVDVDDGMERDDCLSSTHDMKSKQKNQDLPPTDTATTLGTTITINKVSQVESEKQDAKQVQKLRATILHQEAVIKSLTTRLPKVPELELSLKSRRHPKHNMKPSTFGGRWIPPSLYKHKRTKPKAYTIVHTNDH